MLKTNPAWQFVYQWRVNKQDGTEVEAYNNVNEWKVTGDMSVLIQSVSDVNGQLVTWCNQRGKTLSRGFDNIINARLCRFKIKASSYANYDQLSLRLLCKEESF